jgi:hypothetical protein
LIVTLTAIEHRGLTPWIRFGNRQNLQERDTEAEVANDEFVDDATDPEPIDEEK